MAGFLNSLRYLATATAALVLPQAALADDADLAKQLSNPISSLISVPFQLNYNSGYGDGSGNQTVLNIQPVIPFKLNADWNLISRTIVPIINQTDILPGSGTQSGLGDTTQSFFFSPAKPTEGGLIWGVGPVFLLPTGSDPLLTSGKWGVGFTAVGLKQSKGWTVGMLMNHIWSVAGDADRADVNSSYFQPFLSYTTPKATSYTLNTESTYNWESDTWSVPINFTIGQVVKLQGKPVSITLGARYWATGPDTGPQGWGARFVVTYLFPAAK
jgi:hypothetical protein